MTIDQAINLSLDLLETGDGGAYAQQLADWIIENLVHVLDQHDAGSLSRCHVSGYDVLRIGEQTIVACDGARIMDPDQTRMLAAALLRAAEMAGNEGN